ncbi:zf-HC2 domain-containing protein [Methyloterricola oryzae]|uniref:zf-HC2 domain-containing protein n=1 Tax=Methyloterricola oryzae TaxID=1495050 RepID=UPI0005EAFED2|nr:zf-HC2 domain-containing protein [Methyloterricola oryzae]
MNKQTQKSVYSDHDDVLMLLPWYANGTLVGSDLDKVRNHLKVCLTCRREMASAEFLVAGLQREPVMEISYKPSFDRLMVQIRREEQAKAAPAPKTARVSGLAHFAGWLSEWMSPKYLVPALATVTMAAVIPFLLRGEGPATDDAQVYQTLAMPGSMAKYSGSDVQLVFSGDASKQEISRLIAAVQGELVDGPSLKGVYTVRIAHGRDLAEALSRLRQDTKVVFAEPVLGPGFSSDK